MRREVVRHERRDGTETVLHRETVRQADGTEAVRWRDPATGRFVRAPRLRPLAPRGLEPVPPAFLAGVDAAFAGAPGAPAVEQALQAAPLGTGLVAPSACDAPSLQVDSGSQGPVAPPAAAPVLVSAADLVASGASLTFHPGARVTVTAPTLRQRELDWQRILERLPHYVRAQYINRARYLRALDNGTGFALGWAEHRGWTPHWRRSLELLATVLRIVFSALLSRPRSTFGAAALTALYQCLPDGQADGR